MIKFIKAIFKRPKRENVDKLILKATTEAYDKGYKAGANQKDNKPCVCGFWGPDKS